MFKRATIIAATLALLAGPAFAEGSRGNDDRAEYSQDERNAYRDGGRHESREQYEERDHDRDDDRRGHDRDDEDDHDRGRRS